MRTASQRSGPWLWLVWAGLAALGVQCYAHFGTLRDDAYISFRYAWNLAHGLGLRFNPPPAEAVEGYSNFLWVLIAAGGRWLGVAPTTLMPVVGGASAVLLVAMSGALGRTLAARNHTIGPWSGGAAALLTGALPSLAFFAVTGLETALYAVLLMSATWALLARRTWPFAGLALVAFLTRPEAALLGLGGAAWLLLRPGGRPDRKPILALGAAVAGYLLFKQLYFGTIWPNTLHAKPPEWSNVARYMGDAGLRTALLLCIAFVAAARRRGAAGIGAILAVYLVAVAATGADWMPGLRMLVPVLPLAFVLVDLELSTALYGGASRTRQAAALALLVVGCSAAGLPLARELVRVSEGVQAYEPGRRAMVEGLAAHDIRSLATTDMGLPGYLMPSWHILDMAGLTDPIIARQPGPHLHKRIPPEHLKRVCPDAIVTASRRVPDAGAQIEGLYPVDRAILAMPWFSSVYEADRTWSILADYVVTTFLRRSGGAACGFSGSPPDGFGQSGSGQ